MKFLIIFVVIFANVHAAPSAVPNADFFGIFDELYEYFFESDEEDSNLNNQTINVNCFNCTVHHAASQGSETPATSVPTTAATPVPTTAATPVTITAATPVTTQASGTTLAPATNPTTTVMAPTASVD